MPGAWVTHRFEPGGCALVCWGTDSWCQAGACGLFVYRDAAGGPSAVQSSIQVLGVVQAPGIASPAPFAIPLQHGTFSTL